MRLSQRPPRHRILVIVAVSGIAALAGTGVANAASVPPKWVSFYTGPGARDDFGASVAVTRDGSAVFVTGNSTSASGTVDYATVGYDAATGTQLWASRYAGTNNSGGTATTVAVNPAGRVVFVTGYSQRKGFGTDYVTLAYNAATGKQLWLARYDGAVHSNDYAFGLVVSPDGNTVYVTGSSEGGPNASAGDYATIAYDAATGTQLWASRYQGPGHSEDIANALAVSADGSTVFVTGGSGPSYATVAYNASNGKQLWANRQQSGAASAIAVGPGGHAVYVTGTSGLTVATVAYNATTGAKLWKQTYAGDGRSANQGNAVALSPNGKTVYVAGAAAQSYLTIAYNASSGVQSWASTYLGPGGTDSGARQVVVGPGGRLVYITGDAGNDFATVAYKASTGVRRWGRLYPGQGISLAVSPATGAVFVTGSSRRAKSFRDYATFTYPS